MRRFAVSGLLVALSTLVGLVLAEVTVRTFSAQQLGVWYSLRNGMVIHPPGMRIYLANFGQEVSFNSWGMRDVEHRIEKDSGVVRVLLLGDSFMEALQVRLEDSFPRLLEQQLRALTGLRVEVISCAVGGWGTDDQLEYLTRYGLRLRPDLILVAMTIHNDVSDNLRERFHTLSAGRVVASSSSEMSPFEFRLLKVKDYLASRSHLTQLLRRYRYLEEVRQTAVRLDSHVLRLVRKDESAEMARGWELTYRLFLRIREQGADIGARTTVFLIPLAIQLYKESHDVFLARHGMTGRDISLEKPQHLMVGVGSRTGVEVIDLLPAFRKWLERHGGRVHVADGHWNPDGHRIAAGVVADELAARKLLVSGAERAGR